MELGSGCGHIAKHIDTDMMKKLIMCDTSETMLNRDRDVEYEGTRFQPRNDLSIGLWTIQALKLTIFHFGYTSPG